MLDDANFQLDLDGSLKIYKAGVTNFKKLKN